MRSRTPLPQRQQAHWGAFLEAAALFLALCVLGRSAALTLAAVVAAPFPAVQTALWWGQRNLQSETSDPEPEPAAEEQAPPASSAVPEAVQALTGGIEDYLVALQPEDARPADAGAVIEKQYPQGSGEKYIDCGAGSIKNNTRQTAADLAAEIENPLPFAIEKDSPDPQVLVMHTHATEDYRLSAGLWFTPGDGARSTDRSINMCAVGRVVADTLNAAGIHTLHDETLNDYPSYTGSYANSRAVVQQYLAQYPSIKVVLDVHRDAIETENGSRMAPVCTVDGRQAAQVMIICGCDNGTTVQLPDWRQNLRVAAAWERAMEGMYPGFTRPVLFSYRFYNQDLTTGSLLIEIGGHGNNLNEALYAGQLAAKGLAAALLGGVTGALLFLEFPKALAFTAVGILVLTASTAFRETKLLERQWVLPVLSAGMVLAVGGIYVIQSFSPMEEAAPCAGAAALTGVSAYFFRQLFQRPEERLAPEGLLFLGAALTLALGDLTILNVSVGRVLLCALLAYTAYDQGPMTGVTAGLGLGLITDLSAGTSGLFTAAYGVAGLCAAKCRRRSMAALAFFSGAAAAMLTSREELAQTLLLETVAGSLLFLALPRRIFGGKRLLREAAPDIAQRTALKTHLNRAAEALRELYDSMSRTPPPQEENPAVIFDRAAEKVCRGCALCELCWQKDYTATFNALNDATPYLLERGKAKAKDFPVHFADRCIHLSELLQAINGEL